MVLQHGMQQHAVDYLENLLHLMSCRHHVDQGVFPALDCYASEVVPVVVDAVVLLIVEVAQALAV